MDDLGRTAVTVLIQNWRGHATVPSRSLYPHQWSWDSAFIALGLQHWTPRREASELLSMFGAQWADGRSCISRSTSPYRRTPTSPAPRSGAPTIPGHPPVETSGSIQPPVHAIAAAEAIERLGEQGEGFAQRIYPLLWPRTPELLQSAVPCRQSRRAGRHAPPVGNRDGQLPGLGRAAVPADLSLLDVHTRRDLDHAGHSERPTDHAYARYIRLAATYRDHGYDDVWAAAEAEFTVVDPGFNALWAWSELALAEIARRSGRDPRVHLDEAGRITDALAHELFWTDPNPTGGFFYATDLRTRTRMPQVCVNSALPVLLPGLPETIVGGVVDTLTGPCFRIGHPDIRGVVSYDLIGAAFDAQRYWRGPTWLNTTWLVARGLKTHARDWLAEIPFADIVTLVQQSGLSEYFNPHTGSGHGTADFSWSGRLAAGRPGPAHRHPNPAQRPRQTGSVKQKSVKNSIVGGRLWSREKGARLVGLVLG